MTLSPNPSQAELRAMWHQAAHALGLQCVDEGPFISGEIEGCRVEVSNTTPGVFGRPTSFFHLAFPTSLDIGLRMVRHSSVLSADAHNRIQQSFHGTPVATGDPGFDALVLCSAHDARKLRTFLSPDRLSVFQDVFENMTGLEITDQGIAYVLPRLTHSADELCSTISTLISLAQMFDLHFLSSRSVSGTPVRAPSSTLSSPPIQSMREHLSTSTSASSIHAEAQSVCCRECNAPLPLWGVTQTRCEFCGLEQSVTQGLAQGTVEAAQAKVFYERYAAKRKSIRKEQRQSLMVMAAFFGVIYIPILWPMFADFRRWPAIIASMYEVLASGPTEVLIVILFINGFMTLGLVALFIKHQIKIRALRRTITHQVQSLMYACPIVTNGAIRITCPHCGAGLSRPQDCIFACSHCGTQSLAPLSYVKKSMRSHYLRAIQAQSRLMRP